LSPHVSAESCPVDRAPKFCRICGTRAASTSRLAPS
jgi:hypothetical protein